MRELLPVLGVIVAAALLWMCAVWFVTSPNAYYSPSPVATEQ